MSTQSIFAVVFLVAAGGALLCDGIDCLKKGATHTTHTSTRNPVMYSLVVGQELFLGAAFLLGAVMHLMQLKNAEFDLDAISQQLNIPPLLLIMLPGCIALAVMVAFSLMAYRIRKHITK